MWIVKAFLTTVLLLNLTSCCWLGLRTDSVTIKPTLSAIDLQKGTVGTLTAPIEVKFTCCLEDYQKEIIEKKRLRWSTSSDEMAAFGKAYAETREQLVKTINSNTSTKQEKTDARVELKTLEDTFDTKYKLYDKEAKDLQAIISSTYMCEQPKISYAEYETKKLTSALAMTAGGHGDADFAYADRYYTFWKQKAKETNVAIR